MVDLGQETNLGWGHWVVVWEEELEVEDAAWGVLVVGLCGGGVEGVGGERTFVWRLAWAVDLDVEVAKVILMWDCADAWDSAYH